MNCLIVDARTEGRAEVLAKYLQDCGHQVRRHSDQLDVPPGATVPLPMWAKLVEYQDVVFLHVGDYQRNAPQFLAHALHTVPVFCYTGTAAPPEIAAQCASPGIRVLCPDPTGTDVDAGHRLVAVVTRWLGCIEGRSDVARFLDAWHRVRNLDVQRENSLESLEGELAYILRESHWTPARGIDEPLRDLLKTLRDQREHWRI